MNYLLFCSHELISLLLGTVSPHLRSEFSVIRNLILTPFPHSSRAIINYTPGKQDARSRARTKIILRTERIISKHLSSTTKTEIYACSSNIQLKLLYIS